MPQRGKAYMSVRKTCASVGWNAHRRLIRSVAGSFLALCGKYTCCQAQYASTEWAITCGKKGKEFARKGNHSGKRTIFLIEEAQKYLQAMEPTD